MNRKQLINSAAKLNSANSSTAKEYNNKSSEMITKINELMLARQDIDKLVGTDNLSMMKDNHANHARFMGTIIENTNPEVLVDTILWVFNAYQNHGFSSNYWAAQLNSWIMVIKETLSQESFDEVYPFYVWMQVNIPSFAETSKL